jgi:single-stranded-DNA-specific exonuclease
MLAERLTALNQKRRDIEAQMQIVYTDGELAPDELSLDLALLLKHAGPWGQGFPEPQFDGVLEILMYGLNKAKQEVVSPQPLQSNLL